MATWFCWTASKWVHSFTSRLSDVRKRFQTQNRKANYYYKCYMGKEKDYMFSAIAVCNSAQCYGRYVVDCS